YSGLDMFTIEFCTLTGYCDELDIEVNVLSSNYSDCLCLNDCVFKGDNNNDGAVNLRDALGLAVNIGEAGFERTNDFDLIWTGQESTNWGYSQRNQLVDLKAADADGNGFIDYDDFLEFETYYGQVHNFVPNDVGNLSNTPISFIPQSTDLDSGDLMVIDIYAGNASNAVLDMLGLSFSFNIDPEVMDSSSVSFELAESNFLEANGPLYEFVTVPSDGKVDIAVSKLNKLAASGFGLIGTLSFIVEDEIDGLKDILQLGYRPVPFNVNEIVSVDAFGILSRHPNFESEVNVAVQYPDFTQEQLTSDISVYPNPFVNILSIESQNTRIQRLELYDNIGRLIVSRYASGKYESLDLSSIQSGTYLIRITTNKGVITRKVIRLAQ
ncbi:MAG: T9SS type A sorting domain-containing protein, partial [Saprospiraceae bacterium]